MMMQHTIHAWQKDDESKANTTVVLGAEQTTAFVDLAGGVEHCWTMTSVSENTWFESEPLCFMACNDTPQDLSVVLQYPEDGALVTIESAGESQRT